VVYCTYEYPCAVTAIPRSNKNINMTSPGFNKVLLINTMGLVQSVKGAK
jgi:hypothetical protein